MPDGPTFIPPRRRPASNALLLLPGLAGIVLGTWWATATRADLKQVLRALPHC